MFPEPASIPLYHQLRTDILRRIESGELQPGDGLVSESELAVAYGVSKITVRQALRDLSMAGYVRREQGRGTFIALPDVAQGPRELTSFSEEMCRHGFRPSSRVLSLEKMTAGRDLAEKLNLPLGEAVLRLRRLRLADGVQMGVQTAYVVLRLAPGLEAEDFTVHSLYAVLRDRHGVVPVRAKEIHYAIAADAATAALLGVAEGSPVMAAERVTFLADSTPLEFVESVMRGDRYRIALDLAATGGPPHVCSEERLGGSHEGSSTVHGLRSGADIRRIVRSKRLK